MSKKVLIISASMRELSNSDLLADKFAEGARDAGASVEKVLLRQKNIGFCKGCGKCGDSGRCVQIDDASAILDSMMSADIIIFASPVYFYSINAPLKNIMDRCCPIYRDISGKKFYFISVAAENSPDALVGSVEVFRNFVRCLESCSEGGVLAAYGVWAGGAISSTTFMQDAYNLGRSI